ncbi:protein Aster-B isoform X1 [Bactrocera dorsalis]|uniref:Protein Aster-B isoform X1 n=1 Tax=Bactrocera dorsalis TaxID=27457 RepID=A0A6I9VBG6_BACDO|nr:protein Aster-B isoform X1 [Bactrocera dorsalis]
MNCTSTKRQQSTTTTPINSSEPGPFISASPSPILETPLIDQRSNVGISDSSILTSTVEYTDLKKRRPTPPPRLGRAPKITSAAAPAHQTLMIKNIESISTHANAEEKDEEKEEKDICGTNRKSSIAEEIGAAQVNKLKPIKEGAEDTKSINTNNTKTDSDAAAIVSSDVQELGGGDSKLTIKAFSSSTLKVETGVHVPNSFTSEPNLVSTGTNKSIQSTVKFSTVTETLECGLSDADKAERENQNLAIGTTSDGLLSKASNSGESSLSRENSIVLGKNKLPKTPSFSKLSSSLQSSLGALSGSRPDEDTISKSSDTSGELVRGICDDSSALDKPKGGSRLSERAKKKSWYNVLYPNYKSRAEDFKKLFKEVPCEERLIVDYSCALQRDILVQGRLYVSQNYVCFHANIFRWETYLTIRWKDVTSITKEKTALVIPNAISICTAKEKYFFATFTTRDKAFLMLFRVWQNTLMNKQMLPQEIWQWVHNCYGDELGLTTDDEEDYIDPTTVPPENEGDIDYASALEDATSIVSSTLTSEYNTAHSTQNVNNSGGNSSSTSSGGGGGGTKSKAKTYFFSSNKSIANTSTTTSASGSDNKTSDNNIRERESDSKNRMNAKELTLTSVKPEDEAAKCKTGSYNANESSSGASKESKSSTLKPQPHEKRKVSKSTRVRDEAASNNQTNLPTDVSGSSDSEENKAPFVATAECTSAHEGRQLVHTILPINVDTLFNLLFSKSKFLMDFHAMRKTENMSFGEWVTDENGKKTRAFSLTVQLLASVGPKTARVTETQEIRDCSKPGELYSIDVTSVNAGIPYADSFSVLMHYCLMRTVDDHTMLSVHAQIKYKKSIWGVVKGFIEKNTWAGLEEYFNAMQQAVQSETCIPPAKAKGRRPRRGTAAQVRPTEDVPEAQTKSEAVEVAVATSRRNTPRLPLVAAQQSPIEAEPQNKHKWLSVFVLALLFFLIALNVILLLKLWALEERIDDDISNRVRLPNLAALRELPNSNEEWVELLRQQEILHEAELKKWHKVLQTAIELLKKVSAVCEFIYKNDKLTQQIEKIHEEL